MKLVQQTTVGLLWAFLLFLTACAQGGDPQPGGQGIASGNDFSVPLPLRLQIIVTGTLTAEIVVDGGTPAPLTVSATSVTGTINNLSVGSHTFVINYFVNGVIVATANTNATITAGGTTAITFASNAITYPDSDGDGFTNLAEVEIGTDWKNAASLPPGEGPRHSTNYAMNDVMGIPPAVGDASSSSYKATSVTSSLGRSTSANYILGP
ncbi:MAG: hypothetical protein HY204_05650 [Nitrospirae bacterium]|nr:hypothetical protein [Nitrospirota bacterium]